MKYQLGILFLSLLPGALNGQVHINGSQIIDGTVNTCIDAGTSGAYACNLTPAISGYVAGAQYCFKANTANTGAASLNLNSLGAKTIKKVQGGITTDLAASDIWAGQLVCVIYDGTNMQMTSQLGNAPSGSGVMTMSTGAGSPSSSCAAPSSSYLAAYTDTTNQDLWICAATNTWKKVLSTTNTGTFVQTGATGTSPGAPGSGNLSCYYDSTKNNQICLDSSGDAYTMVKDGVDLTANAGKVTGLNGVPFCTGFAPTSGQAVEYTTSSSPNPCYTAASPSGSGSGLGDPGANSIPYRSALNTTAPATSHNLSAPFSCTGSGSGTAQSCTTSPVFTPAAGDSVIATTGATNTGDITLNVNSSSAAHVRKWQGSSTLASADWVAGIPVLLTYDGTYWEIGGNVGNAPGGSGSGTVNNAAQYDLPYYSGSGSANTLSGAAVNGLIQASSSGAPGAATSHNVAAPLLCLDSSGSGTTQSCATSPTFAPAAGDMIIYKTTTTNTGDLTVTVNSSSAAHVRKWQGSAVLASGDLVGGVYTPMTYDGTYWELGANIGNAPGGGGGCTFLANSGDYLTPGIMGATSAYPPSNNDVQAFSPTAANYLATYKVYIPCVWTPNAISIDVMTAGSSTCKYSAGIYNASGTLVVSTGVMTNTTTVACNSTGVKTFTLSTSPAASGLGTQYPAGYYRIATTGNETTGTLLASYVETPASNTINGGGAIQIGYATGTSNGVLPSTLPSLTSGGLDLPFIVLVH